MLYAPRKFFSRFPNLKVSKMEIWKQDIYEMAYKSIDFFPLPWSYSEKFPLCNHAVIKKKKRLEVNPSDLSKHLFLSWRQNLSPFMQLLAQFYSFFPKVFNDRLYIFSKAVYTNYLLFLLLKKSFPCSIFTTMQVTWSSCFSWPESLAYALAPAQLHN